MATNRNDIETKFETGDVPSQADFKEIFDSFVHKDEDKATDAMVDAGIDDEHYVTPALLRLGLKNIGVIAGGGNLPYKQYRKNFQGTFINLEWQPIESSVKVFKNGQLLQESEAESEADYYIDYETATVIFSAPVEGRNIEIDYWYKSTESGGGLGNSPFKTGLTGLATVIWSGEGLKYYVNYPDYYINNVFKSGGSTEVILEPTTSMTNPEKRFDLIYLDINGVKKITGETSESPILPTVDESIAISLSSVLLSAGDTIPTSSEDKRIQVYDENVGGEWNVWKEGAVSFNPNYTGDKFKGTKSIQLVNYGSGTEYLKFGSTSGTKSVLEYDTLSFRIKTLSKGRWNENHPAWPFDILLYQIGGPGFDSATKLELRHNRFGYYQDMHIWHLVTIPLNSFITNNVFFDEIIFRRGGGDMDLLIDDVVLVKKETSTVIQTNNQNAITRIITDNGVAAATSANDTIEIKGTNGIKVENTGKKITIDGSGIFTGDSQNFNEVLNNGNSTTNEFYNLTIGEGYEVKTGVFEMLPGLSHVINGSSYTIGTQNYSVGFAYGTSPGFVALAQGEENKFLVYTLPNKPSGSSFNPSIYTLTTTDDFKTINGESIIGTGDIIATTGNWNKTADNIRNNNTGNVQVQLQSGKKFEIYNSAGTLQGYIDESGNARFGTSSQYTTVGIASNIHLSFTRNQNSASFTLGNHQISQPFSMYTSNSYGTLYQTGGGGGINSTAEHYFVIGGGNGDLSSAGIFRISKTRILSAVPFKYNTDLSSSYDDRTLIDKGYLDSRLDFKTINGESIVGTGDVVVSITNSPVFTGTPTAPTAAIGTNTNQIATTAFVLANAGTSYKVFRAYLEQSGTAAPTIFHLYENTLGGTIIWSRNSTGNYTGTLTGLLTLGKVFTQGSANLLVSPPNHNDSEVFLQARNLSTGSLADNWRGMVEILVYP